MPWEVQQWCVCGGWQNTWSVDGKPQTFATKEEAEAEIKEFLDDINSDGRDPEDYWDADEFRVEEVKI